MSSEYPRAAAVPRRAARPARRRARARARQGHRRGRRHPDQPARHRAPNGEDPPADRLGGQGAGDGHLVVGKRSVPLARGRPQRARAAPAKAGGGSGAADDPARAGASRIMSAAAGAAARRNGWGWYLYGIVAADQAQAAVVPGAGEAPDVVLVSEGPLAGVASRVSLEE